MEPLASYTVTYRGGLPDLPRAGFGRLGLTVWDDRFELTGRSGSSFWSGLVIPHTSVSGVALATRPASAFEVIAGGEALTSGLGSRQLDQRNNIHIAFTDDDRRSLVLRLEMVTGFVIPIQAKRCAELQDLLRVNNIPALFSA